MRIRRAVTQAFALIPGAKVPGRYLLKTNHADSTPASHKIPDVQPPITSVVQCIHGELAGLGHKLAPQPRQRRNAVARSLACVRPSGPCASTYS